MNDFSDKKACDTPTFGKNKDKVCIFGVGTAKQNIYRRHFETSALKLPKC